MLAYTSRHPIIERYLHIAVEAVNRGAPGGLVNATGPSALYRAAIDVLGLPVGTRFEPGTYRVQQNGSKRSLRILEANYTCPAQRPYCTSMINSFGGNVKFKDEGYAHDLKQSGMTHWAELDTRVNRDLVR